MKVMSKLAWNKFGGSALTMPKGKPGRPLALRGRGVSAEIRRAKSGDYIAACDYESACMNGDAVVADRIRYASLVAWLRVSGSYHAAAKPVKVAA